MFGPCSNASECVSGICGTTGGAGNCCSALCPTSDPNCGATSCDATTGACVFPAATAPCGYCKSNTAEPLRASNRAEIPSVVDLVHDPELAPLALLDAAAHVLIQALVAENPEIVPAARAPFST
jgi:hypothetical protein